MIEVHVLLDAAGLSNFKLGFRKTKDNGIQYHAYFQNEKLYPMFQDRNKPATVTDMSFFEKFRKDSRLGSLTS